MKMNLMQEYVKLVEIKNFTKAAEELYIAQPVLSRHLNSVEEELGVKLITRTRNSFELTKAGQVAYEEFKKILASYANTLETLARMDAEQPGEIHLGFLYYDRDYYVSKIREVMKQKYPNVKLVLHSGQPAQLEKDLLEGKIDAAILYGVKGTERTDIKFLPFLKIPFWLIVDNSHRLACKERVQIQDLDGEALLFPGTRLEICRSDKPLMAVLETNAVHISEMLPIDNYDEVSWLLAETGGIYISPMANPKAYAGDTVVLPMPEAMQSDISLVWKTDQKNPSLNLLCSAIRICYP